MGSSLRKSVIETDRHTDVVTLVWLDGSVNSTTENRDVQEQLRSLVNHLKTFDNSNACYNYIQNNSKNNQIILIVSGKLGREIVPRIHRLSQIMCIYVYCINKEKNEKWAQKFPKVNFNDYFFY
jgi:hypothetical protein